jgi:hypothetical protein
VFEHLPGKPEQRGEERNLIQRLHQDEWIPWRMCARLPCLLGTRLINLALGLQASVIAAAVCFAAWPSARHGLLAPSSSSSSQAVGGRRRRRRGGKMKICHIFNSVIRLQHTETMTPKVVCNGCSKPLSQVVSNMRNDGFGSKPHN